MNKAKLIIKTMIPYLVIAFLCFTIFFVISDLKNWNIDIPISFTGDTITDGGTLTLARKAINGDGFLSTASYWTVDDSLINWGIIDASVHFLLMKVLALFISSVGMLVNVYYILTFILSGCFMYYCLKRLNIDFYLSIAIAIIYAFIPGHWQRGINHLAIGSCFALPLLILGCVYILDGSVINTDSNEQYINAKYFKLNRKQIESILGVILVGFSSIYFCVFAMIVHAISLFITLVNKKIKLAFFSVILLMFDLFCAFVTVIIPSLLSNGLATMQFESNRSVTDINTYGMKISQLLLPISGHRFSFFSKLRTMYGTAFQENENSLSSIGLLLSIGLIISVVYILIDSKKNQSTILVSQIGKINTLLIIIAVVGGLSELIGLVVSSIRCYNRMSFFIGCFSAVALALFLNELIIKHNIIYKLVICIFLIFVAIYDQTNTSLIKTPEESNYFEEIWNSESDLFKKIENSGAKSVLTYPSKYSKYYNVSPEAKYDIMLPYIFSNNQVKYTTGYYERSKTDIWIKSLEKYDDISKLKISAAVGFDGVLLYKSGFSDDNYFMSIVENFTKLCGKNNCIISRDGLWYYFSLSEFTLNLVDFDKQKLKEQSKLIGSNILELDREYSFTELDAEAFLGGGFSVSELNYRWSLGRESIIKFKVNNESFGDLNIKLNYLYLFDVQNLTIFIDKVEIYQGTIVTSSGEVNFIVPRELVKGNEIEIHMKYSAPKSPLRVGMNTDSRVLAIAWGNIKVEDSGNNVMMNIEYTDFDYLKNYLEDDKNANY